MSETFEPSSQLQINQSVSPCVLHRFHSPVTIQNELHHVFPEYLQKRAYGMTRDKERASMCATGHNTVHLVIDAVLKERPIPRGVGRKTKEMACHAVNRYREALMEQAARPPSGGFNRRAEDRQ